MEYIEYTDEGKTGTNSKRPGFQTLLRNAQTGCFEAVCYTYMSGLAHDEIYWVAEYLLEMTGVRVELNARPDAWSVGGCLTPKSGTERIFHGV